MEEDQGRGIAPKMPLTKEHVFRSISAGQSMTFRAVTVNYIPFVALITYLDRSSGLSPDDVLSELIKKRLECLLILVEARQEFAFHLGGRVPGNKGLPRLLKRTIDGKNRSQI